MASEIAQLFARIGADVSGLATGLNSAKSMLQGVGSQMQSIGTAATVGLTVPIVGIGTAAVKAATDLNSSMHNIQSIARMPQADLDVLRKQFIGMSTDLSQTRDSADNLAQAFYFIQSSGFQGAEGMTVLKEATKAASAGLTDTQTSANAILATLNAYGLSAQDAAHVSDVLFKTVDLGVLSFGDLAGQLGDVVNTAASTKTSIETVGAALAQMTRKGITSSESVTALNQLLMQFISPSKQMKEAAASMGIELSVAALQSKGLVGMLQEIMDKGGGAAGIMTIFGENVRALKAAQALASDGMSDFKDMLGEFGNVAGRTSEAFAEQTKSWAAQFDNLKNRATATLIAIGEVLVPMMLDMVNAIQPMIDGIKEANPEWVKLVIVLGAALAAIGPVLVVLGTLVSALGALLSPIGIVVAAVGLLGAAWLASFSSMQDVTKGLIDWVNSVAMPALQTLSNWFTSTALPAVQRFLTGVWAQVKPALEAVGIWIMTVGLPAFQQFANWFTTTAVPAVQGFLFGVWAQVRPALVAVSNWITNIGLPALKQLSDWFTNTAIPAVQGFLNGVWAQVQPALSAVGTWIATVGLPTLQQFAGWFTNTAVPAIQGFLSGVWAQVRPAFIAVGTWITGVGLPALQQFANWFTTIAIPAIQSFLTGAWASLRPALIAVGDWIANIGLPALREFSDWFVGVAVPAIQSFLSSAWAAIQPALAAVGDWITNVGLPAFNELKDWFISEGLPAIEKFAKDTWPKLEAGFKVVSDWITNVGLPAFRELSDWVKSTALPAFNDLKDTFTNVFEKLQSGDIKGALKEFLPPGLVDDLSDLADAAKRLADVVIADWPLIKAEGQKLVNWLRTEFKPAWDQVIGNNISQIQALVVATTTALNTIADIWERHGETIIKVVSVTFRTISAVVGGALVILSTVITAGLQILTGDFDGAWKTIIGGMKTFWNLALGIVDQNLDEFLSTWRNNFTMLGTIVTKGTENTLTTWRNNFTTLGTIIRTGAQNTVTSFSKMMTDVANTVAKAVNQLYEAGRDLIMGLARGISDSVGYALSAVGDLVGSILRTISDAFGINSPSTVFAEFGKNMMAGLAQGIRDSMQMPQVAIDSLSTNLSVPQAPPTSYGQYAPAANTGPLLVIENVNLNNGMDLAEFKAMLKETMNYG